MKNPNDQMQIQLKELTLTALNEIIVLQKGSKKIVNKPLCAIYLNEKVKHAPCKCCPLANLHENGCYVTPGLNRILKGKRSNLRVLELKKISEYLQKQKPDRFNGYAQWWVEMLKVTRTVSTWDRIKLLFHIV